MKHGIHSAMAEATQLTRTGRVQEATALLQHTLRGLLAPESSPDISDPTVDESIDATFRVIDPALPITRGSAQRPDHSTGTAPETTPPPDLAGSSDEHGSAASVSTGRRGPAFSGALLRTPRSAPGESVFRLKADRTNREIWAGGRFIEDSFTNHAGTRTYKLYIPSGYRGQALPLVVMLHGCTQGSEDFAAGTRMNVLAERELFFVLYPEQATPANPSRCWNWFKASDQHRGQGEPALIAGLTHQIVSTYHLDARRVYVAGLSAGGAMAMVMGVNYPDVYAAIGIHSGLPYAAAHDLPSAFAAMQQGKPTGTQEPNTDSPISGKSVRAVPTIVFHGDRDTTVHPCNGDQVLAQWARVHSGGGSDNGAGTKLRITAKRGQVPEGHGYTRSLYHDPNGQVILERWLVHGANHAWLGGSPKGSFTDPKGPDASEAMVRFFFKHAQSKS